MSPFHPQGPLELDVNGRVASRRLRRIGRVACRCIPASFLPRMSVAHDEGRDARRVLRPQRGRYEAMHWVPLALVPAIKEIGLFVPLLMPSSVILLVVRLVLPFGRL